MWTMARSIPHPGPFPVGMGIYTSSLVRNSFPFRGKAGMGVGKPLRYFPHPPPNLPLEGGGTPKMCRYPFPVGEGENGQNSVANFGKINRRPVANVDVVPHLSAGTRTSVHGFLERCGVA